MHLEKAWNRNEVYNVYFTHNYNLGYYRIGLGAVVLVYFLVKGIVG